MLAARSLKYERDAARKAEKLARTAGEQAAQSDKERRQELFRAYLAEIRAAHASPQQGHRLRGLQTVKSILSALSFQELTPQQQTELRDETIACLTHPDLREVARYSVSQNIGHPVDLDPTFQFLAVPIGDHDTLIRSLAGESPDVRLSHGTLGATINSERWFSPNGRWLAELLDFVSGNPRRIRVWEWPAQRLVLDLDGPSGLFAPRFHPDGQRCLIVTTDAKVQVYDLLNGQLERESPAHFRGRFLSLRPDLRDLVLLRHEMPPEIADWASLQIKATLSEAGVVHSLAWNPVTMSLYLGARDGRVFQWDDTEPRARPLPHHHLSPIVNLTVSPSGRYLAASHLDRSLRLRALDGNREMVVAPGEFLRFSPDEQRIAVKSDSDLIIYELIDSPTFTTIMQAARAADFSPDGRWLAMSGVHGVQLYSTNPPTLKSDLGLDECGPVAWHPHGRELITFGQFSHAMRWPLKSESDAAGLEIGPAQRVVVKSLLTYFGTNDNIPQHSGRHSAWSADGKLLVYAENRKSHVCTVAESGTPQDLGDLVDAGQVAVTHDGRWIACATAMGQRSVVWRASDRQPVLDLPQFGFVSFSPDGEWFVTTSRSHMRWYRVATWQLEREWPMDVVNGSRCGPVAFQPQGRLLAAVVSRNCVRLFDAPTGDVVANLTYEKQSDFSWLSFSPDGARLAVTRPDLDVSLWDLHSLNRELIQAGLAIRGLPETSVSITNRDVRSLNRGQQLLAPDGWWSSFHTLARFEALHLNWPDAIDDLDKALHVAPTSNHKLRADLLTLRGQYQAKNNRPNAALADWQVAQQLNSDHLTSRRELVRLLLHGPPDLRNAAHAAQHLQNLVSRTDGRLEDQLDLALALLRLGRDRAALEQLERIAPPDLEERPAQWLRYRYLFAETLAKLERTAEAATHFTEADIQWGQRRDSLTADEQRTISEQRQLAKQRVAPD